MRCPRCGQETDRVIDSRAVRDGKGVRRRRECANCSHRYTTYEYVDAVALLVVKRDGRREPYQREKARRGVVQACRKRPITAEQIEALIDRVESRLQRLGGQEIGAPEIGRLVMEELRELDPVAYVRFASVYRRFDSVDAFIEIVEGMGRAGAQEQDVPGAKRGGCPEGAAGERPGGPRDGAALESGPEPCRGSNP
jgi:transcriptional repressor NrdR